MELLFSPCTRLHDILESQYDLEEDIEHDPVDFQDLNVEVLNLNVSTEEFLSAERGFTFADICMRCEKAEIRLRG
jgi:hypothetical protein